MSGVKHDSVDDDDKDFASPKNKKLKQLHKDLGENSHLHLPVPMSCDDDDDPKVAKNDNSLKPNAYLFSEDKAKQLFANWCEEFGRIYYTKEEYSLRFNVFRETLEWVTHQKKKNKDFSCGLTDFADWTHEERLSMFCCCSDSESDTDEEGHVQKRHADKSFVSDKALDYASDSLDEDFG